VWERRALAVRNYWYRILRSCDRASWRIPIIKPTRCTKFLKFILEWSSACFGQLLCPSSGAFHCTHSNGICHTGLLTACEQDQDETASSILILLASCLQNCMTYVIAVCAVKTPWWWTEELSETCRASFQNKFEKFSASSWFYYRDTDTEFQE